MDPNIVKSDFNIGERHFFSFDLGGMPVDVLKSEKCDNTKLKNLILIVPGNPGIVDYYYTFMKELNKELSGSAAIWVLSHSCHSLQSHNSSQSSSIYNLSKDAAGSSRLELEIEHKLRFLEQIVPRDCNITLVGHSIGCFMILSIMEILSGMRSRPTFTHLKPLSSISPSRSKAELFSQISKCCFLFPTIERMKISPNGKRLWPVLNYLQWFVVSLVTIVSWFPVSFRTKVASVVLGRKCLDPHMIKPTVALLTPKMFHNMLHLAYDELKNVKDLHKESIKFLKRKLVFYFGVNDGWCPLLYRNELVEAIPDVVNYVDKHNVDHAFVLSHSHTIASVLAKILQSKDTD